MAKNKLYTIIAIVVAVAIVIIISTGMLKSKDSSKTDGPTYKVKRGPLTISFVESGTIKAREQIVIKNEVEGRTSIISIIPEGTRVKKGDLLIELDASSLEDDKIDQEIRVQNAEASYIGANEDLAVTKNQAESDIALAKLTLEFAKQDLEKYIKGEYPYELDKSDAEIGLAEEELTRAQETLKWSKQLYEEKYISQTELQADELSKKKKTLDLELAKKSKDLLEDYTYQRKLAQLKSDVSQAEMAMERIERKAKANIIQSEASLKAKEAEFKRQKDKLEKNKRQIEKTKIYAPADGLAIYATSAKSRGWRGVEPLEEGKEVREREELIHLPTSNAAKAEISVHESNLKKTRLGMPAVITVDALAGKTFYGTVKKIAPLPDAQSMWMNPDLKLYDSEIYIDANDPTLRTGMSCQAEVIVQKYKDVLYIPLQAVLRIGSEPTVYIKKGNDFEPRQVTLGLDNNKMIHILEGLEEGDVVLLSPPLKSAAVDTESKGLRSSIPDNLGEKVSQTLEKVNTESTDTQKPDQQNETEDQQKQEDGRKRFDEMSPEEKEQMRKRFEQMSPEEKEQIRQRRGSDGSRRHKRNEESQ
ncbi:MAG: hypothetical protein JW806_08525 [Sedimentisphaerales bacterium]|nr:hypothetical protein [Sedimentisphaerales bacterium]